jgi:hypothetical protein
MKVRELSSDAYWKMTTAELADAYAREYVAESPSVQPGTWLRKNTRSTSAPSQNLREAVERRVAELTQ